MVFIKLLSDFDIFVYFSAHKDAGVASALLVYQTNLNCKTDKMVFLARIKIIDQNLSSNLSKTLKLAFLTFHTTEL